jgi:membrane protease YdiL (CAAX protease family)
MRAFAWFAGLIAFGLACIAVLSYPAWVWLHPHFDFPFHRIGERLGMLGLLLAFVPVARHLHLADRRSLGYGLPRRRFLRALALGLVQGALSMALVVMLMTALGLLEWRSGAAPGAAGLAKLAAAALGSGLAVAFIEETFLRGAMHTAIEREAGTRAAVWLTALVYAATHFFARYRIPADRVTAWSGVDLLAGTLHEFAQPFGILDAFACLTAVGVVLGWVRSATGNIAACIGLHAGWVWVILMTHAQSEPNRASAWGFLLSRFDGFVGWLVLAWTLALGLALRRYYAADSGVTGASTSSR